MFRTGRKNDGYSATMNSVVFDFASGTASLWVHCAGDGRQAAFPAARPPAAVFRIRGGFDAWLAAAGVQGGRKRRRRAAGAIPDPTRAIADHRVAEYRRSLLAAAAAAAADDDEEEDDDDEEEEDEDEEDEEEDQ